MAFPIRFLIDECVSPTLVSEAHRRGHTAWHVNQRKLDATPDPIIFKACLKEDLILVTNNAVDFLKLYGGVDLHPGLVVLLPSVKMHEQQGLFARAIEWIEPRGELVNMLLTINVDGSLVTKDFPAA